MWTWSSAVGPATNAFATLYREQAPRLFALTRRMGGSPEEGGPLQEVFLQAYRNSTASRATPDGTWLIGWLSTIASTT
jgi:DNA-directed RNA polymerase specialized sigma24 family protein